VLWERSAGGEVVRARVAEVVGLAMAADGARPEWMIGVIRWIRIDEEGRVDAGIELLARHALPVGVRALDDDRRAPVRGLLLASMNPDPGIDYDALLASTEIDRSVRELELTAPPDLIGHPAKYHKRGQVSDDVDSVDQGQCDLGETQLLLVDDVERGCDRAAGEQRADQAPDSNNGCGLAELRPCA